MLTLQGSCSWPSPSPFSLKDRNLHSVHFQMHLGLRNIRWWKYWLGCDFYFHPGLDFSPDCNASRGPELAFCPVWLVAQILYQHSAFPFSLLLHSRINLSLVNLVIPFLHFFLWCTFFSQLDDDFLVVSNCIFYWSSVHIGKASMLSTQKTSLFID